MKTQADTDASKLLLLLQSCHSILGTAWPRPGYPDLAGARTFLGTNLFTALENGSAELDRLFAGLESIAARRDLPLLWRRCSEVIKRLRALGRSSDNPRIDRAFNLLYLSTGVLYQEVAQTLPEVPKQDARFSTVEDVEELLHLCRWEGTKSELARQMSDSLAKVLETF
jgi:hypothetical protein